MFRFSIILMILIFPVGASAMESFTEHTFRLAEGESPPPVRVEDVAWLAGSWTGTAFGKRFEEVWNPPSEGTMVGMFKLMGDEGVEFYELLTLSEVEGRLSLKVKHFSADFVAWEAKEDFVNFRVVGITDSAVHFHGISFYRLDKNRMEAYLVMRQGEAVVEQKLTYTRVE